MVTEEDRILINRYLDGSLPSNQASALRGRLKDDELLQKSLNHERELRDWLIQKNKVDETMAYLRGLTNQGSNLTKKAETPIHQKPKKRRRYLQVLAASVAALLLVFTSFWLLNPSNETVVKHRPLSVVMGSGESEAARLFNAESYAEALPFLTSIENPQSDVLLAIAISFIETERFDDALPILDSLGQDSPNFTDAVFLYKGLIYYRKEQPVLARSQLGKIPVNSYYYPAARRLLKKK